MKRLKYISVIFSIAVILGFSGCGGGGSGSVEYPPINEDEIGIMIVNKPNYDANLYGSPFADNNIYFAKLKAELKNEKLFPFPYDNIVEGDFNYFISYIPETYTGTINFYAKSFISPPIPESEDRRQYLGAVELTTSDWKKEGSLDYSYDKITLAQFDKQDLVFSPGQWYDVALTFANSYNDPTVEFLYTYEESENGKYTYKD